jgi:hypothetical protein
MKQKTTHTSITPLNENQQQTNIISPKRDYPLTWRACRYIYTHTLFLLPYSSSGLLLSREPHPPRSPPRPLVTSPTTYNPRQMNTPFPNPNSGVRWWLLAPTAGIVYPVISLCSLGGAATASLTTPQPVTIGRSDAAPRPLLLSPSAMDGHKNLKP